MCAAASRDAWKGSLGLIETLLRRGTKACVASLWDLRSKSATLLASRLYAYLIKDETFGHALRKARLDVARKTGTHDPTWAAYTLYGDPRLKLRSTEVPELKRGKAGRWLAMACALLILIAFILFPVETQRDEARIQGVDNQPRIQSVDNQSRVQSPDSGARIEAQDSAPPVQSPDVVGYILLESTPQDAKILIDGNEIGMTPLTAEVAVGNHRVTIEKQGYKQWEAWVEVGESQKATIQAYLEEVE
jgi:hypothetical protein